MIRKIVISVLVVSGGVIAWAGISGLAEWGSHGFGWGNISDRYSGFIGVIGDSFLAYYIAPTADPHVPRVHRSWKGFGYTRGEHPNDSARLIRIARCPFWVPVLLLATYPNLVLIKTVRGRHRAKPGHCSKCGYHLTGLPEPRCPECGTEFER